MPSIGEQLKQAREKRKLTLKQVMQATRVRLHYLQAMEQDDFESMPSEVQARGFLRLYADFLGLQADELLELMQQAGEKPQIPVVPEQTNISLPITELPEPAPNIAEPSVSTTISPDILLLSQKPEVPTLPLLSHAIFSEIGLTLSKRREMISLSMEEVERHTHIRRANLELIEAGELDELASPVQVRGMLQSYASFMDMDVDALLLRYADAIQSRRLETQVIDTAKTKKTAQRLNVPIWMRQFISADLVFGGSMIIMLLALSIWGAARILSTDAAIQSTPTSGPSISDVLLASPIVSPTQAEDIPTTSAEDGGAAPQTEAGNLPSETPANFTPNGIQVTVIVLERTYLRVIVDGETKQDGRVSGGAALTFDGINLVEVLTGSGAAVQIVYNQNNIGVLGTYGEVVNRIFTRTGMETPTPTASATASITPKPSKTPLPSATTRPTSTPRPTITPRPTRTPTKTAVSAP